MTYDDSDTSDVMRAYFEGAENYIRALSNYPEPRGLDAQFLVELMGEFRRQNLNMLCVPVSIADQSWMLEFVRFVYQAGYNRCSNVTGW